MESIIEKYQKDINKLVEQGKKLLYGMFSECRDDYADYFKKMPKDVRDGIYALEFKPLYNAWYNESLALIRQLVPDRVDDFVSYYKQPKRKSITYQTYTISDYLIGLVVGDEWSGYKAQPKSAVPKFEQQLEIVKSLQSRFDSSLYEIRQLLQADLFDSELAESKVLCKNGYYRAAGAVCGVILENHLGEVCNTHHVSIPQKNPSISNYNEALKNAEVIDVPTWRHIQLLGDYRNKCDHKKSEDPTVEEIESLIAGTEKIIKTVF